MKADFSQKQFAAAIDRSAPRIARYLRQLQGVAGIFLMGLGFFMGHSHFRLIWKGVRTEGTIVGYKQQDFTHASLNRSSVGTFPAAMPLVEFRTGDRSVRFQDWKATRTGAGTGGRVGVIFDPANPTLAMIDRPVWNWIPWAPTSLVGLLLLLVCLRGRASESAH